VNYEKKQKGVFFTKHHVVVNKGFSSVSCRKLGFILSGFCCRNEGDAVQKNA